MQTAEHWENVYRSKPYDSVSWYAPHLEKSLQLIEELCPDKTAGIVDIGGGASTLVDDLIDRGYSNLSVLDISATALDFNKQRLGSKAENVRWHVGDITHFSFGGMKFDLWHDRAVFHFLTDRASRKAYVDLVRKSVKPGGHVLLSTFGPDGPERCSSLDVVRYDSVRLYSEFGESFQKIGSTLVDHHTPSGASQQFLYCWCKLK